MSSGGQIVGAVVGGVVGFVGTGGSPGGVLKGAAYGASIGAALDPPPGPDIEGPKISDNAEQSSSYGANVSSINGKIGVKGTVIWVENNKKKIVAKKEDSGGGKGGGGGSETTTYEAFVTCLILLTDHQIDGIERLWFGSDLVANGLSTDLSTAAASGEIFPTLHLHTDSGLLKAALETNPGEGTVRLYPGYDDQPVDPRMEADLGAGNCPAYRGYSLLFLYDYPLKDYSNSIAGLQVKAECIKNGSENSAVLLRSDTSSRLNSVSEISAVANYVYPDETVVLTPTWTVAPGVDTFPLKRLNYGLSGPTRDGSYSVVSDSSLPQEDGDGPGWVQRGITDDPDFYTTGAFAGTLGLIGNFVGFTDAGGRFAAKGDEYAGTIWAPARGIYRWSGKNVSAAITYDPGISTVDVTLDDSLYTYALLSSGIIKKYDSSLTEVDTKTLTFEADSGVDYSLADNFIHWDSGVVYFIFGRQARYIHAMPDDFSSNPFYICDVGVSPHGETATSELLAITAATVKGGILTRFTVAQADQDTAVDRWLLPTVGGAGQSLASVVRERLERSELIEPADIDVSLLTGNVTGYATSGISSVRSTVSPLMSAYNFDIQPHGYQLKCIPRGQSSVMTIDYDDLDARPFGSAPGIAVDHQREMDAQLPKQLLVDYIDAGRNYNRNQESSIERISSTSVNKESYEVPFVFTPNEAATLASVQMDRRWLERDDFAFVLPQSYNRLEAADVVDIETPYASYELRLTSVNLLADGRVECTAKLNDSAIYTQNATGGTRVEGDTTISFAGKSIMHLLDIPLIRDEDDKAGFAGSLCGKSSGWPGGTIIRSVDSGQTFQPIQGFVGGVTSGICSDSLPVHDGYVIDRTNTLTVNLYNSSMSLSSITEEQMLTGKHWAAYGVAGRWELIQFANATLNADDTYTLDTFIRGAKGTEQYADDHVNSDIFILLADADAAFIAANISDIGVERIYRGVTTGKDIDTVADTAFTYAGVNLKPLSPVQLAGSIDGSDNWDLTWVRRSRLTSSEWVTGVAIPVGESSESYEIDIMNGSTVVRTLTSTTEAVEYTSADQVTDFGGNQTTLTFRVYQMSATVGRGYVAETTL